MRRFIPAVVAAAVLGAAAAATAAPTPTYSITFTGTGTEHQLDHQQNIQDSGLCDSAEHVDVTASLAWTASWTGLKASGRGGSPAGSRIDGSTVRGTNVKDACGLDLSQAPPGWVSQSSCAESLLVSAAPLLSVRKTATSLVLAVAAPSFSVPVGATCSLNLRNDQFAAHVVVPLKKLNALKKRGSLVLAVGTLHPGPGDLYAPSLDCSQPTKPYDGYRTADHCQDDLSWSGTLRVTRTG
jgi:hypothetical protein